MATQRSYINSDYTPYDGEWGVREGGITHILHHFQEQAVRPVPQRVNLIVGWAACPSIKSLLKMVQDIRLFTLT